MTEMVADEGNFSAEIEVEFGNFRYRARFSGREKDFVQENINQVRKDLSQISPRDMVQLSLPFASVVEQSVEKDDVPMLSPSTSTSDKVGEISLLRFYPMFHPKSQNDKVAIIAFHMEAHRGMKRFVVEDFEAAFDQLSEIPVEKPSNVYQTVRNAVNRKNYLFIDPQNRELYGLTNKGREYVTTLKG